MMSIRWRLFAILLLATGLIWLSAVVWLQYSAKAQIERVLDSRLAEAGQMVSSLLADRGLAEAVSEDSEGSLSLPNFRMVEGGFERQLHCQVWSLRGTLLGQSGAGPAERLGASEPGFSMTQMNGERWRVYTVINEDLGVEIVVGESLAMRENLVADVRAGLLWPIVIIAPLLAFAIWLSVGRGLLPLRHFAADLATRRDNNLSPVVTAPLPPEMRPVGAALNGLLARLDGARSRERDFIAYAAHELKTPMAGIKTQAQVAKAAPSGAVQSNALDRLTGAVDRTTRLVNQLLDLARIEDDEAQSVPTEALEAIAQQVVTGLQDLATARNLVLRIETAGTRAKADPIHLGLALRNVVENALNAAASGTDVVITLSDIGLEVHDTGPGIDAADLPYVTQRFFTGATSRHKGSGLGLALSAAAVNQIGWILYFRKEGPQGQVVGLSRVN